MKILNFEWDNAIDKDHNGKHLIIGQHLPKQQNENLSHLEVYGISLDIIDNSKDYRLKRISCYDKELSKKWRETGKCTMGDIDFTRHKNVEYINDFPCEYRCKDCGTFWID